MRSHYLIAALAAAVLGLAYVAVTDVPDTSTFADTPVYVPHQPTKPTLAIIGDSFTAGTKYGGIDTKGYPAILAATNHWQVDAYAIGGTGIVNPGPNQEGTFDTRVLDVAADRPDLVVIAGGGNDVGTARPAELRAATTHLLDHLAGATSADIVVIGPVWTQQNMPDPDVTAAADAMKAAANRADVPYVNPTGWFIGHGELLGPDGVHPTDAGHLYLASKMDAALEPYVKTKGKPPHPEG